MRRRILSDSKEKQTQSKNKLKFSAAVSSHSVHLQGESKTCEMHLLVADTFANSQESPNSLPANLNSVQPSKTPPSNPPLSASSAENSRSSPAIVEDAVLCNSNSPEGDPPAGHPHSTARPASFSSVASSRTSRGSGYFSSSSTAESQHQTPIKGETKSELRQEMSDTEGVGTRPVLNKVVESVKEEEESEEGFVDDDNFSSVNEKHFNNSSNIEDKLLNKPKLTKQRSGVSVKDINKKLSEVDHLSPIATMSMVDNPHLTYVDRIILELLETERMYVRALEDILAGYILAIKNTSLPVSSEDIEKLFLNIKDIYAFNRRFLCFLENCESDPVKIAEHFLSLDASFSVYTKYCTNYPVAVAILTRWMKNPVLADFFKSQQASLRHNLPLGSYLLKPVQRILKYHLIMQELVKNCDEEIENYWVIEHALHTMTYIARHINEMKRKHEDAVHIQEIQSLLTNWQGDDLTTYGEIVMEGELKLQGAKNERFVVLFDKVILITKRREDGFLVCKINIMCSDLILLESVKENPLSFLISPFDSPSFHSNHHHSSRGSKQYVLTAKYPDDKKLWTQNIKRLIIKNHHAAIPLHAQQSIMNTETGKKDDTLDVYRKKQQRYSNASIDDYKRSSLKRFGTTVSSSSSFSLSGKGPIRRRSISGSQKSVEPKSPIRKQEKEQKKDAITAPVVKDQNTVDMDTITPPTPQIDGPLSPKVFKDPASKKQDENNNKKEEHVIAEIEVPKKEEEAEKLSQDASDATEETSPTKIKKKNKAKKTEQYKKSVIYRRHKRRRASQPTTGADNLKNNQFPTQEKVKEEKMKLDVTKEDFETAEDFLSFNVDTNRDSVSWDIQIVEAAFERYKQEKAQAEEELRAATINDSPMIPMPNRHHYNTHTDSSGDEEVAPPQPDKIKSPSKNFDKPATSPPTPRDNHHAGETDLELQTLTKPSKGSDSVVSEDTELTTINDRKKQLLMKSNRIGNRVPVEHPSESSIDEKAKEENEDEDGDPFDSGSSQSVGLPSDVVRRPSLQERRKYFERLKEIRERRYSQNFGFDPDSIQAGLVKGMIEQHRESMTLKSNESEKSIPPRRKPRKLSELLSFTQSEAGRVAAHQQSFENNAIGRQPSSQHENSALGENVAASKPLKQARRKSMLKHPFEKDDNPHLFRIPPLRKTNYRNMEFENDEDKRSNVTTSSLPLNFSSSSENEDAPDVKSPVKLKFKNFLQPQMLLWRSVSVDKGSNTRRSTNLMIEATSPKCVDQIDEKRSVSSRSSVTSLGENKFPFKELGGFETTESSATDQMSEQFDCVWNDLEKRDERTIQSAIPNESVRDSKPCEKINQTRSNSTNERFAVKMPHKIQTSTASLHNSPVSPASAKTNAGHTQLANKQNTDHEQPSQIRHPATNVTELKSPCSAENETESNDARACSVRQLAQQFDKISASTFPSTNRSYGRNRPHGTRKHLSDLRLGHSSETSSTDTISYEEIKRQAKSSILRRNSTSAKLRMERHPSPPRKASGCSKNTVRLYRRASDRIIPKRESASFVAESPSRVSEATTAKTELKEQCMAEKARLQDKKRAQAKYPEEKSENAKSLKEKTEETNPQKHLQQVKPEPEKPKDDVTRKENSKQGKAKQETFSQPALKNDFAASSHSLNAFYAAARLRSTRRPPVERPAREYMTTRASQYNRVGSRQKKKDLPPSDFVAAFCKV